MIVERDGLTYVPLSTFARLSGVARDKVRSSIENGIIHHSYVLRIKIEELSFKFRTFIREDKAEAYQTFISKYKTHAEIADICRKQLGIAIDNRQFLDMILQGYIPYEWCVFVYPNFHARNTYISVDKIHEIADAYLIYVSEWKKRKQKGNKYGEETVEYQQPENAELYRPNPECEGFVLMPEQIELIKLFRKYRENREPLF